MLFTSSGFTADGAYDHSAQRAAINVASFQAGTT